MHFFNFILKPFKLKQEKYYYSPPKKALTFVHFGKLAH